MSLTDTVTADATPRPIYRILAVILGIGIVALLLLGVLLGLTYRGTATSSDLAEQGKHRDCVTTIQNARRAVYDNVDIYKAVLIKAGVDRQLGIPLEGDMAYYADVDNQLGAALIEARRLQPATTLNRLIENGGVVAGVRYPACPG